MNVRPCRYSFEVVTEETSKEGAEICPYCSDVVAFCKCLIEDPICTICFNVKTECFCPGNERKRIDIWKEIED